MRKQRNSREAKTITLVGHRFIIDIIADMLKQADYDIQLVTINRWNDMNKVEKKECIRQTDIMHFLVGRRDVRYFAYARFHGIKTINHYVGTDVLWLLRASRSKKHRAFLSNLIANRTFCVCPHLQKELRSIQIRSDILFINHREMPDELPLLPEKLAVYTYIPQHRSAFYGWPLIKRLAHDFPSVDFYVLAHDGSDEKVSENITFLGWQDSIEKWIKKSYIYIRITDHDGLPKAIIEALAYGRQVIFNHAFPHCCYAKSYDELRSELSDLLHKPALNVKGAQYMREFFHPDIIRKNFINMYESL